MIVDMLRAKGIVDRHLGAGISHKNGETSYFCPFCNHHKRKLQVNLTTNKWHCWVCECRGLSVASLLRKSNAPYELVVGVRDLYGESSNNSKHKYTRELTSLPEHYKPLHIPQKTPAYKQALHYATIKRGLSTIDILRYQIGYCESGPYAGMLIVPSYDENNNLNFYVGRSFYKEDISHKIPPISKDIVVFENQINWKEPIIVVEGVFDAISTKRNAIPLIGKTLPSTLKSKIISRTKKIYLALDKDALKTTITHAEYFIQNGVDVYLVELSGKDPNEVGYLGMLQCVEQAKKLTFLELVGIKLSL